MDLIELLSRLFDDGRLSHMERLIFLLLVCVGGRERHIQHMTLGEIGEYSHPKISAAALSDAIGPLIQSGWIEASKPSAKESWDIRINSPSKTPANVRMFEHKIPGAKITVTIETVEEM